MTTANHLINALAAQNADDANTAFESMIQDRISDYLEVRKVELASTIMDDLQEGALTNKYDTLAKPFHVPAKDVSTMQSIQTRVALKAKKLGTSERSLWNRMRLNDKSKRLQGEETIVEGEHTAAHELVMYADNDSHLYKTSHQPIVANLKKKVAKGVYDHAKATKLWGYHADRAAQKYAKEHGDGTPWHKMFTPSDRAKAAKWFANGNKEEIHEGVNEALEAGSAPSNAQLNRNVLANIRKASQTLKVNVNPTMAAAAHRDFGKLAAKNPKAPGYLLMRKLSAQKAQAMQGLTSAGVPLGQALEANPNEFNQAIQRIKRFK